jgi:hypothetical protein
VLLVADTAPLLRALLQAVDSMRAAEAKLAVAPGFLPAITAIGAIGDEDPLDDPLDPSVDREVLRRALEQANVPAVAAPIVAEAIANREDVLDLSRLGLPPSPDRPPTLFELHALADVIGDELAAFLPTDRVRIERALRRAPSLNQCAMGEDGIARITLLASNGTTLAGRAHALIHELGHALIGHARLAGRPYGASYGQMDYGRFLREATFDRVCDEEALVRAIADAWLLRREGVEWARTYPGAVDPVASTLDADDLAAFCRFRLAQGLGLRFEPVIVARIVG